MGGYLLNCASCAPVTVAGNELLYVGAGLFRSRRLSFTGGHGLPNYLNLIDREIDMTILLPGAEESRVFFAGAQLPPLTRRVSALTDAKDGSDTKVGDSDVLIGNEVPAVIGFADNLDEDKKQAAADSIHFAERYAKSKADINLDPVGWHYHYGEAMRNCGWTMTSSKYQDHVNKQVNVSMDSIVLDIIKAVAGKNAPAMLGLLGGVFDKIQSEDKLVTLFDNNSKNGTDADFRIVPCLQSAAGTAITAFLAVDLKLSTTEGGAWFWKWKVSELKMKKIATMVELNMRVHERNRELIYKAIDKSSEEFFSGVKL